MIEIYYFYNCDIEKMEEEAIEIESGDKRMKDYGIKISEHIDEETAIKKVEELMQKEKYRYNGEFLFWDGEKFFN